MQVQPYLFFNGQCEEALRFYSAVFDAEISAMMRYGESPEPPPMPMPPEAILHASVRIGDTELMASDDCTKQEQPFSGFSLSFTARDAAHATRVFRHLAEGGRVIMPLSKTFFAEQFGMVADRFGVTWMITI